MVFETFNGTQPHEILTYINGVTNGWFGTFMLLVIFLTFYMSLGNLTPKNAFAASIFITTILSVIFWFVGIIPLGIVYLLIGGIILSIIFLGASTKN